MKYKQLSISAFADNINVNRSSMTHIFNGRNQPSLDIAKKILTAFPDIRTEWLIMGVGEMLQPVGDSRALSSSDSMSKVTTAVVDNMRQTELFGDYDFEESGEEDVVETKTDDVKPSVDADAVASPSPVPIPSVKASVSTPSVTSTASVTKSKRSSESHNSTKELKRDRISNSQADKKLVKIVFFYDDRSFEEYLPS